MNADHRKSNSRQNNSVRLGIGRIEKKSSTASALESGFGECNFTYGPLRRFGYQLRLKRQRAGYDPEKFADKVGMDLEYLAAIEFGYASLKEVDSSLDLIAGGLGIPSNALRKFLDYLNNDVLE